MPRDTVTGLLFIIWLGEELGKLFSIYNHSPPFSGVFTSVIEADGDHDILEGKRSVYVDMHTVVAFVCWQNWGAFWVEFRALWRVTKETDLQRPWTWMGTRVQPSLVSRYWGLGLLIIGEKRGESGKAFPGCFSMWLIAIFLLMNWVFDSYKHCLYLCLQRTGIYRSPQKALQVRAGVQVQKGDSEVFD